MPTYPRLDIQLAALTVALDDPGTDLQAILAVLTDDLMVSIPSFLGLAITVLPGDHPVIVNTLEPHRAADVRASAQLPLPYVGADDGGDIVLYSGVAGAFTGLAAHVGRYHERAGELVLDGHFPTLDGHRPVGVTGVAERTAINEAVGILIDQGHAPAKDALVELRKRAVEASHSLHEAARVVIHYPPGGRDGELSAE